MSVREHSGVIDWDGLRYFRAVASKGTLSDAARVLHVQHTTVARQLDRLEQALGARLFLRNPRGYVLTRLGETLLESVDAIGSRVEEVARLARGEDVDLAGSVRVATADLLATHVVLPALLPLTRARPQLEVTLVSDTRQHDLSRREADLAVRLGASSEPHLISRRLGSLGFGLYAARGTFDREDAPTGSYVMFDASVGPQPHDAWLANHDPGARIVFRANRQHTLLEAVRLGVGLGILPCIAADHDPSLMRILGPSRVFSRDLSILLHPDVRHVRRVRAVVNAIVAHVAAERRSLRGTKGKS